MQLKAVENRVTNQFNNQINNLDGRLSKLDKRLDRGLASSAALSGLFQPYNIDKFNLTVGVGGYRSESALAIGTGYRFNESVAAKGGVSTSMNDSSSLMYNASMNFEW